MEFIPEKVWERINKIIEVKFGGIDAKFARHIKVKPQSISNAKSRNTIPISVIVGIKEHLGYSSDYILYGDTNPYSIPKEVLID